MTRLLSTGRPAILAVCVCTLLATGCSETSSTGVGTSEEQSQDELLVLITADAPLTVEPAPVNASIELAADELILNSEVVPELELQGVLYERLLRADPETQRRFSIVRWPAAVTRPRHYHASTERVYMLEGSIESPDDGEITRGVFWEAPLGVAMGPFTSAEGGTFIFLGEGPFNTVLLEPGEEAPDPDGLTLVVDPEVVQWQPLADVVQGATGPASIRIVRPGSATDRAVYLMRQDAAAGDGYAVAGEDIEGYVLSGELEVSDPYHGSHILAEGTFFSIPTGFPTNLFGSGA